MSTNGPPFNPPVVCRDASLQLEDGTVLMARLWHPSSGGPWPALLMRQPYGRAIASTVTYAHPSWWAEHGFLVVVQDVRGMGDSSGQFRGFRQEATDGAATQQWVRALPECNGRLGCYGFSYQGLTQLLSSAESPPPDCLAPAMAGLNECEHWSCEGGAQWWHLGLGWGLQLAALEGKLPDSDRISAEDLRHTYILYLVKQGARLSELERIVGKMPSKILLYYRRFKPDEADKSLDEISSVYPLFS